MDYFLLFRYQLLEAATGDNRTLEHLHLELLKPYDQSHDSHPFEFKNITYANNFSEAMIALTHQINQLALNFTNVKLVCQKTQLFTTLLPKQFHLRQLSMPYVFTNYLDWKAVCKEKYGYLFTDLKQIAGKFNFVEQNDEFHMLKSLIKKLLEDKKIEDSDKLFLKNKINQTEVVFSYFVCIGLPFSISKNEIIEKLIEPQKYRIKDYGISLVFQHRKFTGKAVIKVPYEFTSMVMGKDRMHFGRRYVQILRIQKEEYENYKLDQQRQRNGFNTKKRRRGQSQSSSSSSSSSSRSRSNKHKKYNTNPGPYEIDTLLNEYSIKIRGLPYSLNNWDIEQIFKSYNFVRGSIKLGFLGNRKNGEAVLLFPNKEEAERSLNLQGYVIQGRYLQLKLINKEAYDRFV